MLLIGDTKVSRNILDVDFSIFLVGIVVIVTMYWLDVLDEGLVRRVLRKPTSEHGQKRNGS
jgi:hypothetical protein